MSDAHVCRTGGATRAWLQGIDEVRKRHLMAAMAHNLGAVMRGLFGNGTAAEHAGVSWLRPRRLASSIAYLTV